MPVKPRKWTKEKMACFGGETEAISLNTVLKYGDKLDIENQQYIQEIIHRWPITMRSPLRKSSDCCTGSTWLPRGTC
ncbi:MAG: hypothetical protein WC593_14650 [Methanoregula sp.]